jgi:hypothetical protein
MFAFIAVRLPAGIQRRFAFAAVGSTALATLLCLLAASLGLARESRAQGVTLTPVIGTFAGTGAPAYSGDGGLATAAAINAPEGLAFDTLGNTFIADYYNNRIRVVSAAGMITTFAGTGAQCSNYTAATGACGDGGPASAATFYNPTQMQFDGAGNLFIVDHFANRVRKITATNGVITSSSIITTVAGNGTAVESGNGGLATSAGLKAPHGIAVAPSGDFYINDLQGCAVRKVTAATGIISLFAGNGTCGFAGDGGQANASGVEINLGVDVALDASGNLFIADRQNNVVREVSASTNIISTYAGMHGSTCNPSTGTCGDGGLATSAQMSGPAGLFFDADGDLIIGDADGARIRKVKTSTGIITTIAGTGVMCNSSGSTSGSCGDGGLATSAKFSFPIDVALNKQGNIFFTDQNANRVRYLAPPLLFPATQVGASSPSQNLLLTAAAGGNTIITSISFPNSPSGAPDFMVGTITGCIIGGAGNAPGTVCTIPITFTPAYPGLRGEPLIVVTNAGTYKYGLTATGLAGQAVLSPGVLSTVAGTGGMGSSGDGGPATAATFNGLREITFDQAGNYYLGDIFNNEIRKVDTSGNVTTVAGGGGTNYVSSPGGPATGAALSQAQHVVFDSSGNMYIADYDNFVVARVDAVTGAITVYAGNGTSATSGDGGPATSASITGPAALAIDQRNGNLYIADGRQSANLVRLVNGNTGIITTIAGTGSICSSPTASCGDGGPASSAQFYRPNGIALDAAGNVYVSDTLDNRIRRIDAVTGIITTVAGTGVAGYSGDGGPATAATLNVPFQVIVDNAGDILFADSGNSAIRMISAATGYISTVVGNGTACATTPSPACGDGGPANVSALSNPTGIAVDTAGNLYVVENGTNRVRKVTATPAGLTFASTAVGSTTGPRQATLENIGNESLTLKVPGSGTNPSASTNFGVDASTTCPQLTSSSSAGSVASGASCVLAADFTPTAVGALTGTLVEADNSLNGNPATQTISLSGTGTTGTATVTVTSSSNPSSYAQSVTFTATVSGGGVTPTGTVTFTSLSGGVTTTLGTNVALVSGVATVSTTGLPVGSSTITATYSGDSNYSNATGTLTQTVNPVATTDSLTASPASPGFGTPVTLTYTIPPVANATATPTGTVTFTYVSGGTTYTLGPATISTTGGVTTATVTTSALPGGTTTITGSYSGDTNYAAATATLAETVTKASPTDTLTTSNASPAFGTSVTLTYTSPAVNSTYPTGIVTFTTVSGGSTITLGTGTLNGSGVATLTTSALPGGSDTVTGSYPGDTNFAATTATVAETVAKASPTDTLASSSSNSTLGSPLTLTYTAPAVNGVYPTGTVTFTTVSGGSTITLGTGTLNASGVATLTTSALPVGSDTVTGSYPGDTNFVATTAISAVTVGKSAAADTLATSNANPTFGASVTLTYTVPAVNGVAPTGTVTLTTVANGTTVQLGSGTPNASGVVTVTTTALPAGSDTVTGTYPGDANYSAGTATVGETVGPAPSSGDTFTTTPTNSTPGAVVTLSFTVPLENGVAPTGVVSFYNGSILLGTANILASGVGTLSTSALPTGTDTVTASYPGDADYAAASLMATVTVAVSGSNDTLGTSNASPAFGSPVTFTFTVPVMNGISPTGPVSFYNGTTLLGTGTLTAAGVATTTTSALPAGTDMVRGVYAGDANYAAGTATVAEMVGPASSAADTLAATPANPTLGSPVTLTFTVPLVNGVAPTGSVAFYNGTTLLGTGTISASGVATLTTSALPVGTDAVTANYPGDADYAAASLAATVTVGPSAAADTLASSNPSPAFGSPVTFSFTIPLANGIAPTGAVSFYIGTTLLGSGFATATGVATITTSALPGGMDTVMAVYPGDTNYAAGSATVVETVALAPSLNDTLTASPPSTTEGSPVALAFTVPPVNGVSPTGTVSFYYGTTLLGTGTPDATGAATLSVSSLPVGTDTVMAVYPGDGNYAGTSLTAIETVGKADGGTGAQTLTASTSTATLGEAVTLTYTIPPVNGIVPTGSVSFYSGTTLLGTAMVGPDGTAVLTTTALPAGQVVVSGTYSGDANYAAGGATAQVTVTLSGDFSISATAPQTINPGQSATYGVSLSGVGGAFTSPVTLTATGLPADATVSFAGNSYVPGVGPAATTMTIATSPNHAGLRTLGGGSGIAYGLMLLPLLGIGGLRRGLRRLPRGAGVCLAALGILAGLTALSGCAGGYFGPQPRTYVITVTGTSGALQHSTTVTLTIE